MSGVETSGPGKGAPREGDLLAPWRVTDRLDDAESAAFARMLAEDPDLARGLAAAEEERDAAVAINEALPAASAAMREDLFARIDAHEGRRGRARAGGALGWLGDRLAALSPAGLGFAAAAAVLVIAVQGGLLTNAWVGGGEGTYETASASGDAASGPKLLVGFAPTATTQEVAALLAEVGAEIVAGPKPGGIFVIALREGAAPADVVARLKARSAVVRFAAPSR